MEIAIETERSVYDSLYLALDLREQRELVTADPPLFYSITGSRSSADILWLVDLPKT